MKEISKEETMKLILIQFDNLCEYIAAKIDDERIKICVERVKIKNDIVKAIN